MQPVNCFSNPCVVGFLTERYCSECFEKVPIFLEFSGRYDTTALRRNLILTPNRNLEFFLAEFVPYFVSALDHIYPLCSAVSASSGANSAQKSFSTFLSGISVIPNAQNGVLFYLGKNAWLVFACRFERWESCAAAIGAAFFGA